MVYYNPKSWFGLIFQFHKSDTFRQLFWLLVAMAIATFGIIYVLIDVIHIEYNATTVIHSLLGFVLSLLLVFRTNTAYDRWWEGRKQWGALVNVSRNAVLKANAYINQTSEIQEFQAAIGLYAHTLKLHLRSEVNPDTTAFLQQVLPAYTGSHQPNGIAQFMHQKIVFWLKTGLITDIQFLSLQNDVQQFTDICGACERIKRTPIPYTYSLFIKKFIFTYSISMPFSLAPDFKYYTVPVVVFILYVLASIELIAEEIEDPFGTDSNDLPTDQISETITNSTFELIEQEQEFRLK